ncbi:hypothetical protein [Streptomyces bluensis]|uniref:hypothetical protein n=1 Tax=Streptomyces bluensis TaxID=33897 RepID=UPI0016761B01|nr:hypothetical protein [Streptomyces bluensis]GGZ66114.1 hypothetical protein GCM10010344_35760 [Streptomyces bluensis]
MGSKTVDEAGVETGAEAQRDKETVDVTKEAPEAKENTSAESAVDETDASDDLAEEQADEQDEAADGKGASGASAGVGQGAAAIVSAGLGLVSLTGSWIGTIAQARESLYGQLEAAQGVSVATQIKQVYADSWNANALVAGVFALIALLVGVAVLVRPAFGDPDRAPQTPWIKSVAWAGVSLGFLGLVLAAVKYSDILLSTPTVG